MGDGGDDGDSSASIRSLNDVSVDFLMLADRAEAVNGKLYVMGGAWDRQFVQDFAQPIWLSLAIGILVPWNATNQQHNLQVTIEDFDGRPLSFSLQAGFTAGRAATATPGEVQRVIMALPMVPQILPGPGKYTVKAAINGTLMKTVEFYAAQSPPVPAAPHPLGGSGRP